MSNEERRAGACEEYEFLMMRHFDEEISEADEGRLREHLETCQRCQTRFAEYGKIVAAASGATLPEVPEEEWEVYWTGVYNRIERGFAWTVISVALGVLLAFGLVKLAIVLVQAENLPVWVKLAIAALAGGVTLLFISVVREKVFLGKKDKYRGVIR